MAFLHLHHLTVKWNILKFGEFDVIFLKRLHSQEIFFESWNILNDNVYSLNLEIVGIHVYLYNFFFFNLIFPLKYDFEEYFR